MRASHGSSARFCMARTRTTGDLDLLVDPTDETNLIVPYDPRRYTPQALDHKSLELHRLIVGKLRSDPAVYERMVARMPRYLSFDDPHGMIYRERWAAVVEQGMDAIEALALDPGERGQVMRSCSPFAGVLTEKERQQFLRQWSPPA